MGAVEGTFIVVDAQVSGLVIGLPPIKRALIQADKEWIQSLVGLADKIAEYPEVFSFDVATDKITFLKAIEFSEKTAVITRNPRWAIWQGKFFVEKADVHLIVATIMTRSLTNKNTYNHFCAHGYFGDTLVESDEFRIDEVLEHL